MLGQEILRTISNLKISTSVIKYSDKEKCVYSGDGIRFGSAGS